MKAKQPKPAHTLQGILNFDISILFVREDVRMFPVYEYPPFFFF